MGCLHSFRRKKKFFLEDLCPMLTLFFLTMLCNFVVEISVGGLAWCLKQTQKNFFFEKKKGQPKKFWVPFHFYNQSYCIFFKNNGLLKWKKTPKVKRELCFFDKIFVYFFQNILFFCHFFLFFSDTFFVFFWIGQKPRKILTKKKQNTKSVRKKQKKVKEILIRIIFTSRLISIPF